MSEGLQNSIVLVAGTKGHGKSTWLQKHFEQEPALALIDTTGEHGDPHSDKGGWCPRCPETELDKQVEWLAEPPERFKASFLISPLWENDEGRNLHFNNLCRSIYLAGDMTAIIEEADKWYPNAGGAYWANKHAGNLVEYGRHRQIDLVLATRNLVVIDRKLTSQVDMYILFKQQEPRYLEQMEDRFRIRGAENEYEIVDAVEQLDYFEYVIVDRNKNWEQRSLEL